jgi:hypothetical protein
MPETRFKGKRSNGARNTRSAEHGNKVNCKEALVVRPSWNEGVVNSVFESADQKIGDRGETLYKCEITKKYYTRNKLSIDHITPWRKYCENNCKDIFNHKEVTHWYNDERNLQVVHRSENSSKGGR